MQKPSLYHHIDSKEDLLWEVAWEGAEAFHAALDARAGGRAGRRADPARAARRTSRSSPGQLDVATVFVREWRYLERRAARRASSPSAAATRSGSATSSATGVERERAAHRSRRRDRRAALPLGRQLGLHLAAAGRDTDELADRLYAVLLDGMRGYATP